MEQLLKQLIGKKIDVSTGITTAFLGEVKDVTDGVLYLTSDEDKIIYIAIEKIAAFYECSDVHSRPGFIS